MKPRTRFDNLTAIVTGKGDISSINDDTGQPVYADVTKYSGIVHFWQDSQGEQLAQDRIKSPAVYTVKTIRSTWTTAPALSDIVTIGDIVYTVYSIKGYIEGWESVYIGVKVGN